MTELEQVFKNWENDTYEYEEREIGTEVDGFKIVDRFNTEEDYKCDVPNYVINIIIQSPSGKFFKCSRMVCCSDMDFDNNEDPDIDNVIAVKRVDINNTKIKWENV